MPLPVNVPLKLTPLAPLVTTAAGNCAAEIVPLTFAAVMAYGTGVNCWRGASVVKLFAALVLTAIASQLLVPVNAPDPKSTSVVNRPLVTATAVLVTGPAMATPVLLVANSVNVRS